MATNRIAEWLPPSFAADRPSAPGAGVYLHRATDTGAVTVWDGSAWHSVGGGGGTITASQISDSTVAGRAVLTGTAAEGRAALGIESSTTYDFATSTGVALTNRSGSATVTGGVLRLSASVEVNHYTSTFNAPSGSVVVPAINGRTPSRVRASVRVAALTVAPGASDAIAYFDLWTADATPQRYSVFVINSGTIVAERNDVGPAAIGTISPTSDITTALAAGDIKLELEACGGEVVARYSVDRGSTWVEIGAGSLGSPRGTWAAAACSMRTAAPGSGSTTIDFDDLTVTVWP